MLFISVLPGDGPGGRFFALPLPTWAYPNYKLKVIVYEKHKHDKDGNVFNGIVRPFFATNRKSTGRIPGEDNE